MMYAVWTPNLQGSILKLPEATTSIEDSAFAGIKSRNVIIPAGCRTIGSKAFASNNSLKTVVIMNPETIINSDAFSGCNQLTIYGWSGSTAQQYAAAKNLPFLELD